MKAAFDACMSEVFTHEGGYVNDPHDPGGETNMGISKRSHPKEDIRGMTKKRAAQIYRANYWDAILGDDLPAGIDMVIFDAAVNSGVSRASKWLQQCLGVDDDGRIGPATLAAVKGVESEALIRRYCTRRLAFLGGLKTWPRYQKGWTRRVNSVRDLALRMASGAAVQKQTPPQSAPNAFFPALMAALVAAIGGALKWLGVW